nr:protocadherin gamma-A2-like [Pogona vitticeps]
MEETQKRWTCKIGILQCLIMMFVWKAVTGQIHYSIPEEMHKGSFVGNIAKDLGMDRQQFSDQGLRIIPNAGKSQYFTLNVNSGHLQTSERIDREEICGRAEKCILKFQVLSESKLKLYGIEVEITDINDNAPHFPVEEQELEINEASAPGFRVPLPEAWDPDLGLNSVQDYKLTGSDHFFLDVHVGENSVKHIKLVVAEPLDREKQSAYNLILTASDGGDPIRSGTMEVKVKVLDANDNAPVFSQAFYELGVEENIPIGSHVATISATDPDDGIYGEIKYSLTPTTKLNLPIFWINSTTGEITLLGNLDYEESSFYEFEIQAKDGGGLSDRSKIVFSVTDMNDNAPELAVSFVTHTLLENSPPRTVIAILNVQDRDSGINGEMTCSVPNNIPFQLKKSVDNFYSLETEGVLDRERVSSFNITITVTDHGIPPLSTSTVIPLRILDANDNPPVFEKSHYTFYCVENNNRGSLVFSLRADDADWEENARIAYSILDNQMGIELAPHSSEPGYLVTKVVAVDADSGQNAWLSYQLTKATEPGLFTVGLHTGEIRTARFFLEKDTLRQSLVILVKDNGQPSLSASVTVTVVLADNIPEILSDLTNISAPLDAPSDLTFYLVVAVAFVSCLFFTFLLVLLALKLYRWRNTQLLESGSVNFSGVPVSQFVGIDGVRAFLHSYCHEVSLTRDSRKSQFNISKANYSGTLNNQGMYEGKDPILSHEDLNQSDAVAVLL